MASIPQIKVGNVIYDVKDKRVDGMTARYTNPRAYYVGKGWYYNASFVKTSINDRVSQFFLPVKPREMVLITWTGDDSVICLAENLTFTALLENGTLARKDTDATYNNWYYINTTKKCAFCYGMENQKGMYVALETDYIDRITIQIVRPNPTFVGQVDYRDKSIVPVNGDTALETPNGTGKYFHEKTTNDWYLRDLVGFHNRFISIKAGDSVRTLVNYQGSLSIWGSYLLSDGTYGRMAYPYTTWTAPSDALVLLIVQDGETADITHYYIPQDQLKLNKASIIDLNDEDTPILDGKIFCSFGDSITYRNNWQPFVVSALGGTSVVCGIGSTPVSGSNANAFWQDVRLNTVKAANPDIVTILGGANDLVLNPYIGSDSDLESRTTGTFIGAYSYIINNLLTWKPSLKIIIISTTYAHNDGKDLSQTVTYGQFAEACEKVAKYYHLPYVDMYNESGFNQYTMGTGANAIYSADKIHPSLEGAQILASMVIRKIREVYGVV